MNLTTEQVNSIIAVLSEAREFGLALRNNMDWCMKNIALEYSEIPGKQAEYRNRLGQTFKAINDFLKNCPKADEFPSAATVLDAAKSKQYVELFADLNVLHNHVYETQFLLVKQTSFISDKIAGREVNERVVEDE